MSTEPGQLHGDPIVCRCGNARRRNRRTGPNGGAIEGAAVQQPSSGDFDALRRTRWFRRDSVTALPPGADEQYHPRAARGGLMGNEFTATHTVPECGLPAWARPDPQVAPIATLGGWLPIQLLERLGDWAHIRCENGWEAWTDARPLIEPAASAARSDADDGTILCPQCGKQLDERDPYPAHMADAHG